MSSVSVPVASDRAFAVIEMPLFSPMTRSKLASRAILTAAFRRG